MESMPNADPLPPDIEAALQKYEATHASFIFNGFAEAHHVRWDRAHARLRTLLAALVQDAARWRELHNAKEAK